MRTPRRAPETDRQAPERYFNFLGLVIVRKADVLAATAFLLAAASAAYQIGGYLWGAHLHVFAPDRALVFFDRYSDGTIVTRIAGQLTFTNTGQQGRDGTVREAWVDIAGPEITMRQYWNSFSKVTRNEESLNIEPVDDVYPLQIPGEGTVSKYTAFAPRTEPCGTEPGCEPNKQLVSDTAFVRTLSAHVGGSITLTFHGETFQNGDITPSSCRIAISKMLIDSLGANDWYVVRCAPVRD